MAMVTRREGSWNRVKGNKMDMDIAVHRGTDLAMYRRMDIVMGRGKEVREATQKHMVA